MRLAGIFSARCCDHESLSSSITPKYLVEEAKFILLPYIFRDLGGVICFLLGLKMIGIDLLGLKISPHVLPHFVSRFILCCSASIEALTSDPPASTHISSAKPYPLVVPELIISMALLNAIIQNLAEQTPPWGKPVSTVTTPL